MENKCKNCTYWSRGQDDISFGLCRRYAPSPTVMELSPHGANYHIVWPSTGRDDVCGEFESYIKEA
jgi:hypothetical protein